MKKWRLKMALAESGIEMLVIGEGVIGKIGGMAAAHRKQLWR